MDWTFDIERGRDCYFGIQSWPDGSGVWLEFGVWRIGYTATRANLMSHPVRYRDNWAVVIANPLTLRTAWDALRCWASQTLTPLRRPVDN